MRDERIGVDKRYFIFFLDFCRLKHLAHFIWTLSVREKGHIQSVHKVSLQVKKYIRKAIDEVS